MFRCHSIYKNRVAAKIELMFFRFVWTPDGQFILCAGGGDQKIHVWSAGTGVELEPWRNRHAGAVACMKWSPNTALVASGCTEGGLAMYVPSNAKR